MAQVVLQVEPTVLAAYRACQDRLPVSDQALYDKLKAVEPQVSQALVRHSYREAAGVLELLQVPPRLWMAKLNVKVLDGNLFSSTQHRIKEFARRGTPRSPAVRWSSGNSGAGWCATCFLPRTLMRPSGLCCPRCWPPPNRGICGSPTVTSAPSTSSAGSGTARSLCHWQHGSLKGRAVDSPRKCGKDSRGQAVFEHPLEITDEQGHARSLAA